MTGSAHPIRALVLFNCSLVLFACLDVTNKYLVGSFDVPVLAAARYGGHLLLMMIFLAPRHGREMVRTQRTGLVWLRALFLCGSTVFVILALQRMPVAETSAIVFLTPILMVLGAGPLLGETIGWRGWTAATLGFLGVLLIVRPGSGLDPVGVLFALGCAAMATSYNLMSRQLAATETTLALLFYVALAGTIVFGALLPWSWPDSVPTTVDLVLLASVGVYGVVGHYLLTAAYREAPASLLGPVSYLQLLWVALLGWLVFGQFPDAIALVGMATIGASGVLVSLKTRKQAVEIAP